MNTKKRKIQVIEFPKVDTIKKYDNFQNIEIVTPKRVIRSKKVKMKIAGVNKVLIVRTLVYTGIFLTVTMTKMWITYEVSNLGAEKSKVEKKLKEVKSEVELLENTYITNYDLKQVEKKSKEMGFIHNDTYEYIKINKNE